MFPRLTMEFLTWNYISISSTTWIGRGQIPGALVGAPILVLLPRMAVEDMIIASLDLTEIQSFLVYGWCACVFLQLVAERKIDKSLLPPKKIIGKNSRSLVEKREKDLEVYLQTLLGTFPDVAPRVLAHFLHFHFYVSSLWGSQLCLPTHSHQSLRHRPQLWGEADWTLTEDRGWRSVVR